MDILFPEALKQLGDNFAIRLIQDARPPAAYLWATFLPEMNKPDYEVQRGDITVRSTMAGLVGMNSPYPETGKMELSTFLEQSAKMANRVTLSEKALRELQKLVQMLQLGGGNTNEALVEEVLNFTDALIIQPHLDAMEWMRGQAMCNGVLNWTYNGIELDIDYGVPAANILTPRTGTAGYGSTASTFWADVREAKRQLRYAIRAAVMHPDTADMILYNTANNLEIINQTDTSFQVRRIVGTTERQSSDTRDTFTFFIYGDEGEVIDPANPNTTINVPFCETGKIVFIGSDARPTYRVGQGSRQPTPLELGYTHIAPTVENGGRMGRWARVRTPDNRPWQLEGEGVTNGLPVIEEPSRLVIAETEMI